MGVAIAATTAGEAIAAVAVVTEVAAAGIEVLGVAVAGFAPRARIAAMISIVDEGLEPGGTAGFGASVKGADANCAGATGADARGVDAKGAGVPGTVTGVSDVLVAVVSGGRPPSSAKASADVEAAAAFWARILARISEVEVFFSSMLV